MSVDKAPYIDFGKGKGAIVVRNSKGNYVKEEFKSDIDALNYMVKNGWVWRASYSNNISTSFSIHHLLEKVSK